MAKSHTNSQHGTSRQADVENAEPARFPAPPDGLLTFATALLLVAALAALYFKVLDSPLFFDDSFSVNNNPSIQQLWPLWGDAEHPGPLNPPKQQPTSGRPLVNFTFALNYFVGELSPRGYRITNLVIHFASAMLLMFIVRNTLRLPYFAGQFDRAAGPLALAAAVLWAVHPLQTEPIAYISQRTELLMAFCYLATLYSSMRYWEARSTGSRGVWLILATLACAGGMASKEMMVSAPLIVFLYDWTFVSRSLWRSLRESWPLYVGLGATWILLFALNVSGPRDASAGFGQDVSPFLWWFTQSKILWMYLKLVIWPWPLIVHYELPYLTTFGQAAVWLLLTAALIAGTLWLLWRQQPAGFVGAAVLAILSPTLIVPITSEMAAERRMYLPLAAIVALAVGGAYALVQNLRADSPRRTSNSARPWMPVTAAALVLAVVAGFVSARRLVAYEKPETLWQEVLLHQPANFSANFNLSTFRFHAGQIEESIRLLERAVQTRPRDFKARKNLSGILLNAGRIDEAIPHLRVAMQVKPDDFAVYTQLATAYVQTKQPEEAIKVAEQALKLARLAGQFDAANQIEEWLAQYRAEQQLEPEPEPAPAESVESNSGGQETPGTPPN